MNQPLSVTFAPGLPCSHKKASSRRLSCIKTPYLTRPPSRKRDLPFALPKNGVLPHHFIDTSHHPRIVITYTSGIFFIPLRKCFTCRIAIIVATHHPISANILLVCAKLPRSITSAYLTVAILRLTTYRRLHSTCIVPSVSRQHLFLKEASLTNIQS